MTVLYLMAVKLSKSKEFISEQIYRKYILEISRIDKKIHKVLASNDIIKKVAKKIKRIKKLSLFRKDTTSQ